MSDLERQRAALEQFLLTWGNGYTGHDIGSSLTCEEADVLNELFAAYGNPDAGHQLMLGHAAVDDEGDGHRLVGTDGWERVNPESPEGNSEG